MGYVIQGQGQFTKNRERLLAHDAVIDVFNHVVQSAEEHGWVSGQHFSVDGNLIQAWASHKSFVCKDGGRRQFQRTDAQQRDARIKH